ncbi:DUF1989 domain-containing protein [Microbulbifer sp. S227A]|uniref:DUF1989 domain-containing protein n=1 Tax=Microbulbifer sp. S227A TaxID=3415131 RepID=UPI003C7975F7
MLTVNDPTTLPRTRYRGIGQADHLKLHVGCGEAGHIRVRAGSVVSVTSMDGGCDAWMTARTATAGVFDLSALGLPDAVGDRLDSTRFDHRQMTAMAGARDSRLEDARALRIFDRETAPGDTYIAKVSTDCDLFVIVPVTDGYLTRGGGGTMSVTVKPPAGSDSAVILPEPLGKVRDEWRVSRGTAQAYELKKGEFVQIIDVEGQQCSDFMAMRSSALDAGIERYIDSTVSRTMTRSAYPQPGLGDKFYDQDIHPLLAVRRDTVGRHDTFALACTARGYEDRGFPGHLNCSDNITAAFAPYGIASRRAWPAINFFFNSWIDWQQHHLAGDEAWSRPGDHVVMQALNDLVCVSTACPDDVDPINGWNPTDIHVRIYQEDTPITHSVSWRAQPDEAGRLTRHSAFHPRTSALTSRFHHARDLWVASEYDATGAIGEYWACKNAATLQDMSGLRKYDVVGPDAEALLQHCLTRNVGKLAQYRGIYALMCDARGNVLDDGTLFRLEAAAFRWCCGSDNSAEHLREQAERLGLNVRVLSLGHRMVNLALQGPKSRDILRRLVFTQPGHPALENVKWFGFTIARLHDRDGPMFMLCRSGFTGELGYEIFCDRDHALDIWDALIEAGAPHGLVPMGGTALDMVRIEAGLMIAGAEFGPDCDALEAGLGFAVDFNKENFIGKPALERNAAAPRRVLVGLHLSGDQVPHHGDGIFVGREQVGIVTSACHSPQLGHAIAMARIAVENSEIGGKLEIGKLDGHMKRLPCTVVALPFLDPKRTKARA